MPRLRDLQHGFAAAMAGRDESVAEWVTERGLDGNARLAIYRRAIHATQARTLMEAYPTVYALVGEAYFDHLAQSYGGRFPSRSGNLQRFGAAFPAFLESFVTDARLAYLPDCARLDWLREATALAADAVPVDERARAAAAMIEPPRLLVHLHASVHLLLSDFPVLRIFRWCQAPSDPAPRTDEGGTHVLLWRDETEVAMAEVEAATAAFIESLRNGYDIVTAATGATDVDAGFDFTACMGDLLARRLITGFDLKEQSS